jgi:hypothetical protein
MKGSKKRADGCTLFAGCERATGSFPRPRAIPAVLDISSSHDLHFLMMVGGENCGELALAPSAAKNQALIFIEMRLFVV